MVIDFKQNKKEENKALRFFWVMLIPGRQSTIQGFLPRGVALTQGAGREGPPAGSSPAPRRRQQFQGAKFPRNVQAAKIKHPNKWTILIQGFGMSYTNS